MKLPDQLRLYLIERLGGVPQEQLVTPRADYSIIILELLNGLDRVPFYVVNMPLVVRTKKPVHCSNNEELSNEVLRLVEVYGKPTNVLYGGFTDTGRLSVIKGGLDRLLE